MRRPGGQIMPPLMGAGAFVMVELTGVAYVEIIAAAFLPALLFFVVVWVGINAYCRQFDLKGIDDSEKPSIRSVVVTSAFFLVPFSVLLWAHVQCRFHPRNMPPVWRCWSGWRCFWWMPV